MEGFEAVADLGGDVQEHVVRQGRALGATPAQDAIEVDAVDVVFDDEALVAVFDPAQDLDQEGMAHPHQVAHPSLGAGPAAGIAEDVGQDSTHHDGASAVGAHGSEVGLGDSAGAELTDEGERTHVLWEQHHGAATLSE